MTPSLPTTLSKRPPWRWSSVGWWGLSLGAIATSFYQAGIGRPDAEVFNSGGLRQFAEFWLGALQPDLSAEFLNIIVRATVVTLAYAVCGTTLSVGLGFVGGILISKCWWQTIFPEQTRERWLGTAIWWSLRGLLAFPRAIHELIWGLFFLNILGLDPLVAVLAIALPFTAIVAKVFSEILDETPQEPLQNLLNSGVPPLTAWLYGLLPQALPNLLSYSTYRFECSLRSAAVLGVIGAGGLGYEILLSLQSLRYDQLWTGFYALIVLNGMVDLGSGWIRQQMGFTSRLDINQPRRQSAEHETLSRSRLRPWRFKATMLGMGTVIPLCFWAIDMDWSRLWAPRTRMLLQDVIVAATPHWPGGETLSNLLQLSVLTLSMSIVAIVIAGLSSILASFPAARTFLLPGGWCRPLARPPQGSRLKAQGRSEFNRSSNPGIPLAWTGLIMTRLLLLVSRAVPAPIWALVFLFVLFPGILPGALALAVHNFGILGRLMAEVNENVDDRPARSLHALGASPGQVILYGILPQNLGSFLAYILYRWEVCMRETVIVGLVGAGGLGRLMTEQLSSFDYAGLVLTLGCFIVLTFGVDMVSQQMRATLRSG
ncbi:ABC transporter permease subunit [Oscillatoria sp. CS-180]|uniref:PhnE/PtxC family ABC transporter permease n=1 Tax=Oscillatoria sp. CS-180 TaxID=3021720 RepID=UPI00232D7991|nr:ABC transporter permease subunit [Oscillatoria sp. CS-180]MDB9526911.1 ABC transporter permease subunit [Oscillatoria sp. CS-180]